MNPGLTHRHTNRHATRHSVPDAEQRTFTVGTEDGCNLVLTRFSRRPGGDSVILLHGLTSSSFMFTMDEHINLVTFLLDAGIGDVWCLDWRGSGALEYNTRANHFTLDHVAAYDFPAAFNEIRRHTGSSRLHVISHCIGALTFAMSLAANLVGPIASLICNSVFLVPRPAGFSKAKLLLLLDGIRAASGLPFVPIDGSAPAFSPASLVRGLSNLTHSGCTDATCNQLSFLWGSGDPALFEHDNLDPITHGRLAELFGPVPLSYFEQMRQMVIAGQVVRSSRVTGKHAVLPEHYLEGMQNFPPTLLVSGDNNGVWGDSNQVAFDLTRDRFPELNVGFQEVPRYGHQDIFIGRNCAFDVFPYLHRFIARFAQES